MPSGLTRVVAMRLATPAREEHKLCEADLKEEHNRLQACASTPEGPAAPWVRNEA